MKLIPHEETLKSPLATMMITNRRLRYMKDDNTLQTLSLQEISYMGITKSENAAYKMMAMIFGVLSIMGAAGIVLGEPMGQLVLMGCGLATVLFYLLYLGSKETTLQVQGRGGATITVALSRKNLSAAREIMETVENAKLELE